MTTKPTEDLIAKLEKHKLYLNSLRREGERADLRGADLTFTNLTFTNLRGADLRGAYLTCADLTCADLTGADLTGVVLTGADLRRADLTCADLTGADLISADLTGADLTGADLTHTDLIGADLIGAKIDYQIQEGLLKQIAEVVLKNPGCLEMDTWHTCDTTHCLAGWACTLNETARKIEETHGTQIAGLLTLGAEAHSYFYKNNDQVLEWLRTKFTEK